jgi:hypothetical protein
MWSAAPGSTFHFRWVASAAAAPLGWRTNPLGNPGRFCRDRSKASTASRNESGTGKRGECNSSRAAGSSCGQANK